MIETVAAPIAFVTMQRGFPYTQIANMTPFIMLILYQPSSIFIVFIQYLMINKRVSRIFLHGN